MPSPILLCYNLSGTRLPPIRALAESLDIRVQPVPPADFAQPLGALCDGLPRRDAQEARAPFADEMMVLCHFPRPLLNALLDGMREAGIAPVSLVAVLTPTNSAWDAYALHAELGREREYFRRRQAQQ